MPLLRLLDIQQRQGFVTNADIERLHLATGIPRSRFEELVSSFPLFRRQPPPPAVIRVCRDLTCRLRAPNLREHLTKAAKGLPMLVEGVSCLGQCDRAPAVFLDRANSASPTGDGPHHARIEDILAPASKQQVLDLAAADPVVRANPLPAAETRLPWSIDIYNGTPDFAVVRAYDAAPDPDAVLRELGTATLGGMGGAGFPAQRKWTDVRDQQVLPKYVICNGDESEPGTFKDRELLRQTPWLTVEGVILGARVVGATTAYIYIRHEFPEQIRAVQTAIDQAAALGLCGPATRGGPRHLDLSIFVSPGGYICGEQSALIEALQGNRAEPRNRPPEITVNGLHDQPTLLSNVETFAWVPAIVKNGGAWYRDGGKPGYRGRRFFSICGDVRHPGVYEVPIGITLRELLEEHVNREKRDDPLKAFAPSGSSGGFLPRHIPRSQLKTTSKQGQSFLDRVMKPDDPGLDILHLELDINLFRSLGLMLGAGLVVYGPETDMVPQALGATEFYRNESCGKCVPCRLGSQKLTEIGEDLYQRRFNQTTLEQERPAIEELTHSLRQTSICGLGVVAPEPLTTLLRYFPKDVAAYL